ncbi:MAG: hypothetical protein C0464_03485 [Cyanobacteria bacterium DS2.008]|nr:hypothetical protein [Cyanobacteria bacterium DS2.008]
MMITPIYSISCCIQLFSHPSNNKEFLTMPLTHPSKPLLIHISTDVIAKLDAIAVNQRKSRSDIIRAAVAAWIKSSESQPTKKRWW